MGRDEWNAKYMNHPPNYEKICVTCGKEFGAYYINRKYCSITCSARKRYIDLHMTHKEWVWIREFIIERDNYTCQDCGKFMMDIGLEVHHLKAVQSGGKNDEGNLITLCHKCHKRRHGKRK